jgi:hypothetical protein
MIVSGSSNTNSTYTVIFEDFVQKKRLKAIFQRDMTASTSYPGFLCLPAYSSGPKKSSIFVEWQSIQWRGKRSVGIVPRPSNNQWHIWEEIPLFSLALHYYRFVLFRQSVSSLYWKRYLLNE